MDEYRLNYVVSSQAGCFYFEHYKGDDREEAVQIFLAYATSKDRFEPQVMITATYTPTEEEKAAKDAMIKRAMEEIQDV